MKVIGYDDVNVTSISLENLKKYKERKLKKVFITALDPSECIVYFVFDNEDVYKASGFSIGYSGESPHGLFNAIRMFYPEIDPDFYKMGINKLDFDNTWEWTIERGFYPV